MQFGDATAGERTQRSHLDVALNAFDAALDGLINTVEAGALEHLTAAEKISFWQKFETFRNRLPLIDHQLIADAEATDLAGQRCFSSLAMSLSRTLQLSPAEAAARVRAAAALGPGVSTDGEAAGPVLPHLAAAQRAGEVGTEQVQIVAKAMQKISRPDLNPVQAAAAEQRLVAQAHQLSPKDLRLVADRIVDAVDPDGPAPVDEQLQQDRRHLELRQRRDGMWQLEGKLTNTVGAQLHAILDPLTRPRTSSIEVGGKTVELADERHYGQRLHDGLEDACGRLLQLADRPAVGGTPASVIVTIGVDELLAKAGIAETTDGSTLTADQLLRIADEAEIWPTITDRNGVPLALGRTRRIATRGQTMALIAREGGCSFPGCDHPPQWCDRHHIIDWIDGGPTDLDNLTLLRLSHESRVSAGSGGVLAGEFLVAVNVRSGDLDQLFLMPPSVKEWLPGDHLAFFVLDVVSELDLAEFYAWYRADGRGGSVYDPAMMLAVLLYAYSTGERSSRRIERRLVEDVAYRVLAANQSPDHATLARFRRRHQDGIAGLFAQVLGLCVQAGLVDAGVVAIDGTKIAADASFFANRSRKELAAEILEEAEATDASEDALLGDRSGGELPAEWAGGRDRRDRIRAALAELDRQQTRDYESRMAERAQKEAELGRKLSGPKPTADRARRARPRRANTTDPHSRIIATGSRGVLQGYNAQAAATADQVVLAAEVTATTNDQPLFVPMATAVVENLTEAGHQEGIGAFVADAGYWTAANGTVDVGAAVLIATRKTAWRKADKPDDDKLTVLAKVNRGELSQRQAGEILGVSYTWVRDMTKRYFGRDGQRTASTADPDPEEWIPVIERLARGEISQRAARDELTVSPARINVMLAHLRGEAVDPTIARRAMDHKLADPTNTDLYRKRQHSIEPVFGNIKANLGYRRFARRGLPAVNSEWRLICAAHNMLKLRQARPA